MTGPARKPLMIPKGLKHRSRSSQQANTTGFISLKNAVILSEGEEENLAERMTLNRAVVEEPALDEEGVWVPHPEVVSNGTILSVAEEKSARRALRRGALSALSMCHNKTTQVLRLRLGSPLLRKKVSRRAFAQDDGFFCRATLQTFFSGMPMPPNHAEAHD